MKLEKRVKQFSILAKHSASFSELAIFCLRTVWVRKLKLWKNEAY